MLTPRRVRTHRRYHSPGLEPLESRRLLSCSYDPVTNTLFGDETRNQIIIHDGGSTNTLRIECTSYTNEGTPVAHEYNDVLLPGETVHVFALQQADTVNYVLESDYNETMRTFNIDLGQQHDSFTANFQGNDFRNGSSLKIVVNGNNGKDAINVNATGGTDGDVGVNIEDAASSLTVDIDGNNGKDDMNVTYDGVNKGHLGVLIDQTGDQTQDTDGDADRPQDHANGKDVVNVNLTLRPDDDTQDEVSGFIDVAYSGDDGDGTNPGSNGKDRVDVRVTDLSEDVNTITTTLYGHNGPDWLYTEIKDGGNDNVDAKIYGGNGPDYLTLLINPDGPPTATRSGFIDGGNGPDRCVHTANVLVVNCEEDSPAPSAATTAQSTEEEAAFWSAVSLLLAEEVVGGWTIV